MIHTSCRDGEKPRALMPCLINRQSVRHAKVTFARYIHDCTPPLRRLTRLSGLKFIHVPLPISAASGARRGGMNTSRRVSGSLDETASSRCCCAIGLVAPSFTLLCLLAQGDQPNVIRAKLATASTTPAKMKIRRFINFLYMYL